MSWYPTIMVLFATVAIMAAYKLGKVHGKDDGIEYTMDRLEDLGVIGRVEGSKDRFVTYETWVIKNDDKRKE